MAAAIAWTMPMGMDPAEVMNMWSSITSPNHVVISGSEYSHNWRSVSAVKSGRFLRSSTTFCQCSSIRGSSDVVSTAQMTCVIRSVCEGSVPGIRLVRRHALLAAEERRIDDAGIRSGHAHTEHALDRDVEVGIAVEAAEQLLVIGVELVEIEGPESHQRLAPG
jgi:hypothetical protein